MPTAAINGTTLAYDEYGPKDGVGLVFSHSLFFNRGMFGDLVERFSADHRVVVYDHRVRARPRTGTRSTWTPSPRTPPRSTSTWSWGRVTSPFSCTSCWATSR
ncbi:hypothetical protein GCM10023191_020720 [Actinoallomurus oryzae]|uniref:Alpha/beta hydrolase family protein n=1 Tax=Actinoallomurus oryzae TaxID=502180 RepID=A0ABP8PNY4_9ACTN